MPVSGVVIKCRQEDLSRLAERLECLDSVEVGQIIDNAVVAVIDSVSLDDEMEVINVINSIPGVLDVRLAYHNFEDIA